MFKIPLEDLIAKIKEGTQLSEEDINQKIEEKMKQLSGLISKEGAAHIIANELGVKIFEQTSGKLQIKNILAGMRSVETIGKVTRKFELREFQTETRSGKVASLVMGDETGTIRVAMWGDQADNINKLAEGDIIKIVGGYVRENRGQKEVHMNDRSKMIINPPGEKIDSVQDSNNQPEVRKEIQALAAGDENTAILGTIVQAFEPRFFETCPQCGKRARPDGDKFACAEHSTTTPDYSYVMNVVLDDGTENIRCVFFGSQTEHLLEKTKEDMLTLRDKPEELEKIKTELLGNQIKAVGRVTQNKMFDRIEFVAQRVFTNPNAEEEIKRLNS